MVEVASTIELPHIRSELANLQTCQKLIKRWTESRLRSLDMLPQLYVSLFGRNDNQVKFSEVCRNINTIVLGRPEDQLTVPSHYVRPLVYQYTDRLDVMLQALPKATSGENLEKIIHAAAWAYYVFGRIHPFPDGNGRIGRMVVKRIITGAGLRDLLFHDQRWYGKGKSLHLNSLRNVDTSSDLSYLELYLLQSAKNRYHGLRDKRMQEEIDRIILEKESGFKRSTHSKSLLDIWESFAGILT